MNSKHKLFSLIIVIGLIMGISVGCNSSVSTKIEVPQSKSSFGTATEIPQTSSETVPVNTEISETETPTLTPSPTQTAAPTRTHTPLPTHTWTPLPTLSDREAMQKIRQLLTTNGDCDFPCWWGITPGISSWEESEYFLRTLTSEIEKGGGTVSTGTNFTISGDIEGNGETEIIAIVSVQKGMVIGFTLDPLRETAINYQIDKILLKYGEPQQIYIHTYPYSPEPGNLPFRLILYYPDHGFAALYTYNAANLGDILRVCPYAQSVGPEVEIWDTELNLTIKKLYPWILKENPLLTIEEASGVDKSIFTEEFQKNYNARCIEVPVSLWE